MVNLPEGLLDAVESYLNITWQDAATDTKITGYIKRGVTRLQEIAGAPLDFTKEDQDYYQLLLDYCRYTNSQALEVFEKNFQAELLDLNLSTQAPVIDNLTVIASPDSSGGYTVTVAPEQDDGDSYVYQVGADLMLPKRLDVCAPGTAWMAWDGVSPITADSGQQIMVVEVNDAFEAERAGTVIIP